jgi:hypothetical protein
VKVIVFKHPKPLVPLTVYTVVAVGVTTIVEPGMPPGFQMYDTPPLAVRVTEVPAQTLLLVLVTLSVGSGFTVTFRTVAAVHPATLVPVTEYEVLIVGESTTLLPVNAPGFHV